MKIVHGKIQRAVMPLVFESGISFGPDFCLRSINDGVARTTIDITGIRDTMTAFIQYVYTFKPLDTTPRDAVLLDTRYIDPSWVDSYEVKM